MTIAKIPFNITNLTKLISQPERYEVADTKTPSLRMAVYPSGVKTFFLYKKVEGAAQRIKIGRFPDLSVEQATKEAKAILAKITLGHNPQVEKKAAKLEITFNELLDIYYHQHARLHNKDPQHNKRMMELHIVPILGKTKVKNVSREQVSKIHAQMGINSGHGGANRVIHVLSAIFNFGINNGFINGLNPCKGLKKFPVCSRDRFLSSEEIKVFFQAVDQEEELFRDFFLLLLFTGARKSNVLSMKWAHIDMQLKSWRIPETQTKNKSVNYVALSDESLHILTRRKEANAKCIIPSDYVFRGNGITGHLKDPSRAWQRIKGSMKVQDVRMHDLRRTLGSYMAINGASLPVIGKALNHKSQISTAIYARLSQSPVQDAVNIATANICSYKVMG